MDLLQLKYFQTVARFQQITKAAEKLYISQPSLSITIKHLEQELNTRLFERKGRDLELTENGYVFLNHVNNVFNELDIAKNEIKAKSENKADTITLATTNTRFLSKMIKNYLISNPEIKLIQALSSFPKIGDDLLNEKINCCITSPLLTGPGIECIELIDEEVLLCVPASHKLASRETLALSEVSKENFIMISESYSYRNLIDEFCKTAGFIPNVLFECDIPLADELLPLGRGITLLPASLCRKNKSRAIKFIHISEPYCHRKIGFSKLQGFDMDVTNFESYVAENFKENYYSN
jgi:Transcriptional regulator